MAALPPNWARYVTDDGKEYFHNLIANTTHWELPPQAPTAPSFDSAGSDVFTYKPTASELESPAVTTLGNAANDSTGKKLADTELVSLTHAPGGRIATSSPTGPVNHKTPEGGGGAVNLFGGMAMSAISGALGSGGDAAGDNKDDAGGGVSGWFLNHAQKLFDVSTQDVITRLRLVMMPFPEPSVGVKEELRQRPDFYGPFWVATTAILFLAATGNFARLVEGDHKSFKADYSLVSLAASMIYGCLIAVPVIARASLFVSGEEVGKVDFLHLVCICGYSLAPAIPVSMLCLVPWGLWRWLAVLTGLAASLMFVRTHLLADLHAETPWLKYTLTLGPCVFPAAVFFVYRVHFF